MNYYFVIDAHSSKHDDIKAAIECLFSNPKLEIASIRSSREFNDIKNSIIQSGAPLEDESSWSCIAGCNSVDDDLNEMVSTLTNNTQL